MFKAVLNILVKVVMIVVFIGQAMAFNAAIPCETSEEAHATSSELATYHAPQLDTDSMEDCCGIACCDIGCSCVANACTNIVFINTMFATTNLRPLSESIYTQQSEQPKNIDTPHYRPPIFTS